MTPKRPKPGTAWRRLTQPMMPGAQAIPGTLVLEEWERKDTHRFPHKLFYVTSSVERTDDDAPPYQHLVCSCPRGVLSMADADRILNDFGATDLVLFRLPGSTTRHYFTRGVMP